MSTAVEPTALVVAPGGGLMRPVATPADVIDAQNATRAMVHQALKEGRDYGKIPGTDKPTLLKPGAERVALAFGCYFAEPEIIEKEIDHDRHVEWSKRRKAWRNQFRGDRSFDWKDETGASMGLYRYVVRVAVINRATGAVVGAGLGACSSMESKYIDRPRDCENTVLKMAHKRAIVSAALVTFGLSDEFTQDVEDITANAASAVPAEGEPEITRESQVTWGNFKEAPVAIKDLEGGYLSWAVRDGRKFGADTAKWQAAFRAEIEHRKNAPAKPPRPTEEVLAEGDDNDGLPFN